MHHVNSMATVQYHTRFCIGGQVLSHPHPSEAVHDIVTGGEPLLPIEAQTLQRHLFFVSSLIHDRRIGQAPGRNVNLCCVQRHCPQRVHFFHRAFLSTWEATQADDMGPGEGCVTGLRQAQTKQDSPEPHHFCWGGLVLISHQGGLSLTTACRWPLAGLHFIKSPTVQLVDNLGR